tara:strand:- start:3657 stop:4421 length:765 start_codon:yes stop_codon:yes gene_type:complete
VKDWLPAITVVIVLTTMSLLSSCSGEDKDSNQNPEVATPVKTSVPDAEEFDKKLLDVARNSAVSIRGSDCPRFQFGSGFSLRNGLIVTNAHVVAGIENPLVTLLNSLGQAEEIEARVLGFDPVTDLALLDIGTHEMEGFDLTEAIDGENVALVGYDRDGESDWRPGQIAQHIRATGSDIYGNLGSGRDALVVSMDVDPGHSGSPLINSLGQVVGVTFSSVKGGSSTAYAVQVNELISFVDNFSKGSSTVVSECR